MFLNDKRNINLNGAILLFFYFFCAVFATIQLNPIATTQSNNALPCNTRRSSVAAIDNGANALVEQMRDRPPNAYCVQIESCTKLITQKPTFQKYETRPFSVGGFNWYK